MLGTRAAGRDGAAALRILQSRAVAGAAWGTDREVAAGAAGSKAVCKAEQGSGRNGAKVTFPGASCGEAFAEGGVCKPGEKEVEMRGWVPRAGRCSGPSALHPSPEQLGRMPGCRGRGPAAPSGPSPAPGASGSSVAAEALS